MKRERERERREWVIRQYIKLKESRHCRTRLREWRRDAYVQNCKDTLVECGLINKKFLIYTKRIWENLWWGDGGGNEKKERWELMKCTDCSKCRTVCVVVIQ